LYIEHVQEVKCTLCMKLMCIQLVPEQEYLLLLVACVHEILVTLKLALPLALFHVICRKQEKPVYEILWFAKLGDGHHSKYLSKFCCLYLLIFRSRKSCWLQKAIMKH
jgi:hypothetical protein